MTEDEPAFLRSVAAAPADDTPRLVYADWLDEHGQPVRAEFIRLQVEIAKLETKSRAVVDRNSHLWRRQQELLDEHTPELLGPLAGLSPHVEVEFHRGFVSEVTLDAGAFLEHAAELAAVLPRPAVSVERVATRLADFLASPHLDCVNRIGVYDHDVFTVYESLPAVPDVPTLLDATGKLTRLELLDLEGCQIGDHGAVVLAMTDFPALTEVDLSSNQITDVGVTDLLAWPVLRRLRRLVLGGNPIGDQGAFELADRLGPHNRLDNLNLRFTNISPDGQRALLSRFGGRVDIF